MAMKTPPLWICRTVAVLCVGTELVLSLSGPAPYEKIRPGMTMDKVSELLGELGAGIEVGTAGGATWDRGAISVDYSPGGLARNAGDQTATRVQIAPSYSRLRWLRYRARKCYSEVMSACERLTEGK